ncbi:MAG: CBS domain-containing protein [Planctomycetaceae bacterium]|nr:CBS domain-containing protein [Planctomycetaceae bacterium]
MDTICTAKDLMSRQIVTLSPRMNVLEAMDELLRRNATGAPVIERNGLYRGVFSEKCCLSMLTLTVALASQEELPTECNPTVSTFMKRRLFTLDQSADVMDGIGLLLRHRVSGAPVIDNDRNYLGIFSEKSCMDIMIGAFYDQLPTCRVLAYLNTDPDRLIPASMKIWPAAGLFVSARFRRLVVLEQGRLIGLVARRDLLQASRSILKILWNRVRELRREVAPEMADTTLNPLHCETESVAGFMDVNAGTIAEETDLLTMAQIFRDTNFRRLPVLRDGFLQGMVERKDLLKKTYCILEKPCGDAERHGPLHLSALERN